MKKLILILGMISVILYGFTNGTDNEGKAETIVDTPYGTITATYDHPGIEVMLTPEGVQVRITDRTGEKTVRISQNGQQLVNDTNSNQASHYPLTPGTYMLGVDGPYLNGWSSYWYGTIVFVDK